MHSRVDFTGDMFQPYHRLKKQFLLGRKVTSTVSLDPLFKMHGWGEQGVIFTSFKIDNPPETIINIDYLLFRLQDKYAIKNKKLKAEQEGSEKCVEQLIQKIMLIQGRGWGVGGGGC